MERFLDALINLAPTPQPTSAVCGDDVVVDGTIITGENYDAQAGSTDPEWKYISVRR